GGPRRVRRISHFIHDDWRLVAQCRRHEQGQGLTVAREGSRKLVKWSQERSVSVNKGALVFDEHEELAVAQDRAWGESVAEPVKVPVGEIKTIGGGGVIKFH